MSVALADPVETPAPTPEPDVSVIIPVFDAMPYLTRCLDSVLEQTIGLGRLEIIAVDDGSGDGSGQELDRYAARFADRRPAVITVEHQANSGGPALPCNRGLELARGRYVFFLGADDYLGPEALERLVDRADAWGSDVIFGTMKGVNGRYVDQRIFAASAPDLDLLTSPLPYALSNTKLFRRALLEQHGIRYALDLRVGSDQPFVIEALTHARRISVLDDYVYYYAVRRAEATNITYSASWQSRLADITALIRHIADLVEPGPLRDAILARHFGSELDKLLRRQLPELSLEDQQDILAAVDGLAAEFWTDELSARVPPEARIRLQLARTGDLPRLLGVVAYLNEVRRPPLVLRDGAAYVWSPVFEAAPEQEREWHRVLLTDDVPDRLARGLHLDRIQLDGESLQLRGRIAVSTDSAEHLRLRLLPITGSPPGRTRTPTSPDVPACTPALEAVDGATVFTATAPLVHTGMRRGRFAVRMEVQVGDAYVELPLRWTGNRERGRVRRGVRVTAIEVKAAAKNRLVLTLTPQPLRRGLGSALRRVRRLFHHSNQEDR